MKRLMTEQQKAKRRRQYETELRRQAKAWYKANREKLLRESKKRRG